MIPWNGSPPPLLPTPAVVRAAAPHLDIDSGRLQDAREVRQRERVQQYSPVQAKLLHQLTIATVSQVSRSHTVAPTHRLVLLEVVFVLQEGLEHGNCVALLELTVPAT
jgi:hypothetical protein